MEQKSNWDRYPLCPAQDPWFRIHALGDGVYAIYEPYHFQEVISYLIVGGQKAALWDTGMGIGNIQKEVAALTDLPLIVVNSHVHFDHVGDNHRFESVLVFDQAGAVERLRKGYRVEEMAPHTSRDLFAEGHFVDLASRDWHLPGSNPVPIQDGAVIDLGGRCLELLHTPGHSPESIMALDRQAGLLFTGDTFYPGHLYAHFSGEMYQDSDLAQYAESMRKVAALEPLLKAVHPSHNEPGCDPSVLSKTADALAEILAGKAGSRAELLQDFSLASLPEDGASQGSYVVADDLWVYHFEHVNIICRKMHK